MHNNARLLRSYSRVQRKYLQRKAVTMTQARYVSDLPVSATRTGELRHIGPSEAEAKIMLEALGVTSREELIAKTVPKTIQTIDTLGLQDPVTEVEALTELKAIMDQNKVFTSYIGKGYFNTHTPLVILRNIVENPAWYTPYTPYQAEISQGRLEMLLNYQTMCSDLTGLPVASASLLDEGTACAEAIMMLWGRGKKNTVLVDANTYAQTVDVLKTRATGFGWNIQIVDAKNMSSSVTDDVFAVVLQYPGNNGVVEDFTGLASELKAKNIKIAVATDLLALTQLTPPGEWGADCCFGSSQRLGVPLGYGGPHAAFLTTTDANMRKMPGRIIGVSKDSRGKPALRMAMQAREQHIRRDKASSNICTAQALLANVAAAYGVWHGPQGLKKIGETVNKYASIFAATAAQISGVTVPSTQFFDTVRVVVDESKIKQVVEALEANEINVFVDRANKEFHVSFDEVNSNDNHLNKLLSAFAAGLNTAAPIVATPVNSIPANLQRTSPYLTHPVFNSHRSETAMLRYLYSLQQKDLSLATAMIPLGSCTMKLNSTSEMIPITWPTVNGIHPFVPESQVQGYKQMLELFTQYLCTLTGFDACSLQPNSGAQGEYAGLQAIRRYHAARGEGHRNICLIPSSAHGTNPASAVMAGLKCVVVKCDEQGNIDVVDLEQKAQQHAKDLAAIQLTYPSTHGVFEEKVRQVCNIVHQYGGQVYLDGANMNAQMGVTSPGDIGADVCHLNIHKTLCVPHGGGGPGMGPICVRSHLAPFLPGHVYNPFPTTVPGPSTAFNVTPGATKRTSNYIEQKGSEPAPTPVREVVNDIPQAISEVSGAGYAVSSAPYGSASILPISWMYMRMMGARGLKESTRMAILNANYMMHRLKDHYDVLYTGADGMCAHEFILDIRPLKAATGISEEDIAKRLMDFNFHAPTMSFPVPGTLMIEPTESEPKYELDRFIEAMITIRKEIQDVADGKLDKNDNPLKNAPHTADMCLSDSWKFAYPREQAAYPLPYLRLNKYWPTVGRLDNVHGDRNVVCTCPPIEEYM